LLCQFYVAEHIVIISDGTESETARQDFNRGPGGERNDRRRVDFNQGEFENRRGAGGNQQPHPRGSNVPYNGRGGGRGGVGQGVDRDQRVHNNGNT